MSMCYRFSYLACAILLMLLNLAIAQEEPKKTKVFILVGQSNMEGHAKIETLPYLRDDPASADLFARLVDSTGQPRSAQHVWISYLTGGRQGNGEGHGRLTAGFGSRPDPQHANGKIGPEFSFGLRVDQALDQPVLLIKTAWGGKSLFYDFRPPSAGIYPRTERDQERNRWEEGGSGKYYRLMIEHVQTVLQDPERVCPDYDAEAGYELAGLVWFQGWNDLVNHDVYPRLPPESPKNKYATYTELLEHFIRDVRRDLDAPALPVVIGVMGVGGYQTEERYLKQHQQFRAAMAAPASNPEFEGSVFAVHTADFWDERLGLIDKRRQELRNLRRQLEQRVAAGKLSTEERDQKLQKFERELLSEADQRAFELGTSNAAYHYLGSGKIMALIGEAFADVLLRQGHPER